MSFQFNKIQLKDWLVYGGNNEVKLPPLQSGRNLIVVNGQNGYGKTSLLRALEFVFKGGYSPKQLLNAWNQQARAIGGGCLSVGIEFIHGSSNYKIIRGADFDQTKQPKSWVKLFINGEEDLDQIEDKIEQLLPKDCLEFVFFDGAEISRYAQRQHGEGIQDAIEKVLGIQAVRNLRADLDKKLIPELEREQEGLLSSVEKAQELLLDIADLESEAEGYRQRRINLVERRDALDKTIQSLENEAQEISIIEADRMALKEKNARRAVYEERLQDLDKQVRSLIGRAPLVILKRPLKSLIEQWRAKMNISEKREQQRALYLVITDLLKRQVCLCNRSLNDENVGYLEEQATNLEHILSGGGTTRQDEDAFQSLSALLKMLNTTQSAGEELIDKRLVVEEKLEELNTDINRLEKGLEGHEEITVRELYDQIGGAKNQLVECKDDLRIIDQNSNDLSTRLRGKKRELADIGVSHDRARQVTTVLEKTRRVHQAVAALVNTMVQNRRGTIENKATQIFRDITNKPQEYDCIHVNPDYSMEIVRKDGSIVESADLSAGEKEVLAYSFITALNLSSVSPAPFVMDTPFGHLDSGHRKRLLNSLPELKLQAIILATDRDLPPSERDSVDSCIAKEFTLERDQKRALTTIRED